MAVTKLSNSGIKTGVLKYDSMLAGNSAYIPPSFESIATASGSGVSSVTFSSIPSTYAHLQIRCLARDGSGGYIQIILNNDTNSVYSNHIMSASDSNNANSSSTGSANNSRLNYGGFSIQTTNFMSPAIIDFHEYANTTWFKTMRAFFGYSVNASGSGTIYYSSGNYRSTSAISQIQLVNSQGVNWQAGTTFALYGIKG